MIQEKLIQENEPPYKLCIIKGCSYMQEGGGHHEPPKSLGGKSKRSLCRIHHEERHRIGYKRFKEKYPEYELS